MTENTLTATLIPLAQLGGNETFIWDIAKRDAQALTSPNPEVTKALYLSVATHVQQFPEELEFCAFDLHGTMFDDKETYANNVAHYLDEAVALSTFLAKEIKEREERQAAEDNWPNPNPDCFAGHDYFPLKDGTQKCYYCGIPETPADKRIIVLINNWDDLFKVKNPEHAHLYMDLWTNLQIVILAGEHRVHVLMQTRQGTAPTAPESSERIVLHS